MAKPANGAARPSIILSETDADRLSALAVRAEKQSPVVAGLLLDEIARARIVPDRKLPPTAVAIGSTVEFIDEARDARRTVSLVLPADADIAAGRISVLTPIGAGLIGLSIGQTILWPDRDGHERRLRILEVRAAVLAE